MIEVEQLSKQFGRLRAVDSLSFQVGAGEVLGFLGPNGAGKSTTMKMITGFLAPTSGTARICGHDIQQQPLQAKRSFGYLPEGAPGYADMNVLAFLRFIAQIRGLKGAQAKQRVDEVIDSVHLHDVLGRNIEALSKGYKRRVGLAQAIIHDPQVLILDEPTDGLDPNQKFEVRKLIQGMAQDKIILVSTHILEEVSAVCSRAMIIANGKMLADDTPDGLAARSRYHQAVTVQSAQTDVIADFFKSVPAVADVEIQADQVTLFAANGGELFGQVQQAVKEQGWAIGSLYQEQGRMDEVFRTITEGNRT